MQLTTVFFDLDGTLLPMDEDTFTQAYFKGLVQKLIPYGYEQDSLVKAIWSGVKSMLKNTGTHTNEEMFWKVFTDIYGEKSRQEEQILKDFYVNEFQQVRKICGFDETAASVVAQLKQMGLRVVLATNPLFPAIATESRVRWAGLSPEDFAYISTYENSHYSKPNPDYYKEIMDKVGVKESECIMVGNNVEDDMITRELGMQTFLVPNCLINKQEQDISVYQQGDLKDLLTYIKQQKQLEV